MSDGSHRRHIRSQSHTPAVWANPKVALWVASQVALGVTVLTSESDTSAFDARLEAARASGCDGVVCSGHEIGRARAVALRTMVPGVRFADGDTQDQARVATPRAAIIAGADWLVIGRAVTAAPDPAAAAAALHDEVAAALAGRS